MNRSTRLTARVRVAPCAALVAALLAGCGPVPGGRLDGTPTPPPSSWSDALGGDRAFCEIESRPSDPHSIQLDCFVYEDRLYVQSHRFVFASWWPAQSWAAIWLDQPDVRARVGDSLYEVRAVHVVDPKERGPILESRGYDAPVPEGIALFRFDARGTESGARR